MNGRTLRRTGYLLRLFSAGVAAASSSCGAPTESGAALKSGDYLLVAYDGRALPADIGSLPNRDGTIGQCRVQVASGILRLDLGAGRFEDAREFRESCGGTVIATLSESGDLVVEGSHLSFTVHGSDRDTQFTGVAVGTAIRVLYRALQGDFTLEYRTQ